MTDTVPFVAARESTEALARYEALDPTPDDPKDWFDQHYPNEMRPVVMIAERGAELAIRLIEKKPRVLTESEVLRYLEEHGYPGWQFSDDSGVFFNPHQRKVWDFPGDEYPKRLVTPDQLLESSFLVDELTVFGTRNGIHKAIRGPYRSRLHLLLESRDDFLREQTILALGEGLPEGARKLETHT